MTFEKGMVWYTGRKETVIINSCKSYAERATGGG